MVNRDSTRLARLLFFSVVLSWGGAMISAALGGIVMVHLTGKLAYAGVPFVIINLGAAIAAYPAGHLMDRFGRRPVLLGGHVLNTMAFLLGAVAITRANLALFAFGYALASIGTGATYLTRLAAADLYPEAERGRGVALVVFGAVFGAVLGTPFILAAAWFADVVDRDYLMVAWTMVAVLSYLSALVLLGLRPDPQTVALELQAREPALPTSGPRMRPRIAWRPFLSAGAALVFAQASMIMVMASVSAHLDHMGAAPWLIAVTMTAHLVGMFLFTPLMGRLADRWGRVPLLLTSGFLLTGSSLGLILVPLGQAISIVLFVIGVGWSFAFIGASTMIADATHAQARGRATAAVDSVTALLAAGAAVASGWALETGGIERVGGIALALNLLLVAAALVAGLGGFSLSSAKRSVAADSDS